MQRKKLSILTAFLIITGIIILILSFTIQGNPIWLDVIKILYWIIGFSVQLGWYMLNKNEKIENVDDEEIKRLLKEGKKVDAIKKIKEDNKCSLLNAIFYVGDIEKSLQ